MSYLKTTHEADMVIAIGSSYKEIYEVVKDRRTNTKFSLLKLLKILPDRYFNEVEKKILQQTIDKLSKFENFT